MRTVLIAHRDIPMLVTAITPAEADAAADVLARAPHVVIGGQDRAEMLQQVNQLMTRTLEDAAAQLRSVPVRAR